MLSSHSLSSVAVSIEDWFRKHGYEEVGDCSDTATPMGHVLDTKTDIRTLTLPLIVTFTQTRTLLAVLSLLPLQYTQLFHDVGPYALLDMSAEQLRGIGVNEDDCVRSLRNY
jgi:hypothetical protein